MPINRILLSVLLTGAAFTGTATQAASPDDIARMQDFMTVMKGYYEIVEAVHDVASDQDKSAILQLQKIEEIYKSRGNREQAIIVLRDVLEKTERPALRNAAAVMLADALNETGQVSEAVEVLTQALDANLK